MDRERNPNRPGIGETIFAAGNLVHSHPALLVSWLVLVLAGGLVLRLSASPAPVLSWGLLVYVPYGLAATFISAGYMGSLHLILKLGGWSSVAVIECGRHYFLRFFLIALIRGIVTVLPSIVLGVLAAVAVTHIPPILISLLPVATVVVILAELAFHLFLVFAPAGVVVEEKSVFEAIAYSFRVVRENLLPTVVFLLIFSGVPVLFAFLIGKFYGSGLELPRIFFTTLLTAYGHLFLMAALVYFAVEIGRPAPEEI